MANLDINVSVSEKPGKTFKEAQHNLMRLTQTVPAQAELLAFALARDLTRAIEKSVVANGLVEEERSPSLKDSFNWKKNSLARADITYRIRSDHPGAKPLEVGASPHRIEPDKKDALAWIPENPSSYFGTGAWNEDRGNVTFHQGVNHPGNDEYNYVYQAQIGSELDRQNETRSKSKAMVRDAGFSRTPGR